MKSPDFIQWLVISSLAGKTTNQTVAPQVGDSETRLLSHERISRDLQGRIRDLWTYPFPGVGSEMERRTHEAISTPGITISRPFASVGTNRDVLPGWIGGKRSSASGTCQLRYAIVDVFAHAPFRGIAVAVVFDANDLSDGQMQDIAREFNLSETAFVLRPADSSHTADLRTFAPSEEIAFAGHPSIAAAFAMARQESLSCDEFVFALKAGVVRVNIERADGEIIGASLAAPQDLSMRVGPAPTDVAAALCLTENEICLSRHPPTIASVGMPSLIVEASDVLALKKARVNQRIFDEIRSRFGVRNIHIYVNSSAQSRRLVQARNFAPFDGAGEDPATGSATAALAALLAQCSPEGDCELRLEAHQGIGVGRPSVIHSLAVRRNGKVGAPQLAGRCIQAMRGIISV